MNGEPSLTERTARSGLGAWATLIWFCLFVGCLGGAVFLGMSYAGRPLVPGAVDLFAPAGALLLVPAALQLAGRLELQLGHHGGLILLAAGLALLGVGMWLITGWIAWRLLALPGLVWYAGMLAWELARRPSHSRLFTRARDRGAGWMWQAYIGAWLIVLVSPVGILWTLGLIQ